MTTKLLLRLLEAVGEEPGSTAFELLLLPIQGNKKLTLFCASVLRLAVQPHAHRPLL